MNDVLVKTVGEALRGGELARLLDGLQAELDGGRGRRLKRGRLSAPCMES